MKIKTISYQRVKNLGNYESERLEMFAELDEDEDPDTVAVQLRLHVNSILDKRVQAANSNIDDDIPEGF
jgi:hypothetical protein